MSLDSVELFQFPYSHFNEKARWALDLKKVPHSRTNLLPGPHTPKIQKMTGGTTVPVVRFGETIVAGSDQIIDELERRFPEPALYPGDPELRAEALALQRRFDADLGPMIRRSLFNVLVEHPGFVVKMFAVPRSKLVQLAYRSTFPFVTGMIVKSMGITGPNSIREADACVEETLEFVADRVRATGYLVGDGFTVADLTACALFGPAADPPNSPMFKPRPLPGPVSAWIERWHEHPALEWVRNVYVKHRPASSQVPSSRLPGGA